MWVYVGPHDSKNAKDRLGKRLSNDGDQQELISIMPFCRKPYGYNRDYHRKPLNIDLQGVAAKQLRAIPTHSNPELEAEKDQPCRTQGMHDESHAADLASRWDRGCSEKVTAGCTVTC